MYTFNFTYFHFLPMFRSLFELLFYVSLCCMSVCFVLDCSCFSQSVSERGKCDVTLLIYGHTYPFIETGPAKCVVISAVLMHIRLGRL